VLFFFFKERITWCLLLFLFILDNRSHVVAVAGGLLPTGLPPRIWPTLWRVEKQGVWPKKLFFHLYSPTNTIKTSINHLPTSLVSGVPHRGYNRSIIIQRKKKKRKGAKIKTYMLNTCMRVVWKRKTRTLPDRRRPTRIVQEEKWGCRSFKRYGQRQSERLFFRKETPS
jgi:hypothetical protein